jgi:Leucine-rich repeat (LRR) protein
MKRIPRLTGTIVITLGVLVFLFTKCEKEDPIINLNSPYFTITDQAFFYALLRFGVDTNGDSLISNPEAEAVSVLNFNETHLQNNGDLITNMTGIEAFVHLVELDCGNTYGTEVTNLSSLDVSNNTALVSLKCANNYIQALDISNCAELIRLECWNNGLNELDISNNTSLRKLLCVENRISNLDISNNANLSELLCSSNRLTSLDAKNNPDLVKIWVSGNNLSRLDVSQNSKLEILFCGHNLLSSLDVSNNTSLKDLSCDFNQLYTLDVSNNTELKSLNCRGNQLTDLDVSNNTELRSLWCGEHNQLVALNISNNTKIGLDHEDTALDISYMPTLTEVCVWTMPFPPEGIEINVWDSPNITFTTECSAK